MCSPRVMSSRLLLDAYNFNNDSQCYFLHAYFSSALKSDRTVTPKLKHSKIIFLSFVHSYIELHKITFHHVSFQNFETQK